MFRTIGALLQLPIYPWLVGVYPILHLYSENIELVIDSEVMPSILLLLFGTSMVFYLFNRMVGNEHLAGFITSACSIAFSLSGHIYVLVFMPKSLGIWTAMILLGLAIIIFALQRMRSHAFFAQATPSFNLIALALLLIQLLSLAQVWVKSAKYVHIYAENIPNTSQASKVKDSPTRPDIYYIIPDGYPSDSWLQSTENYDNSAFSKALRDRGFTVIGHARSNYANTRMSLPSVLNMRYYPSNPSPYSDLDFLRLEAANSEVARLLADMGYTYIQLLSGSFVPSPLADIVREFTPQGTVDINVDNSAISKGLLAGTLPFDADPAYIERSYKHSFFEAYAETTILRLVHSRLRHLLQAARSIPYHTSAPERFLDTIDEVVKISGMPEATFTIAHFLKPHQPVVFDESGEPIPWNYEASPDEFFAELRFINSKFLHLIDSILGNSEHPPVIIFQADHGSILGDGPGEGRLTLFDIYAAYHLPAQHQIEFPKPFTAVNSFRLVMNAVFDSGYELQTDRLIEHPQKYDAPFEQVDVTKEFLNDP